MKHENLCGTAQPMIRGKFVSLNVYIRKETKSKVNNLSLNLRSQ